MMFRTLLRCSMGGLAAALLSCATVSPSVLARRGEAVCGVDDHRRAWPTARQLADCGARVVREGPGLLEVEAASPDVARVRYFGSPGASGAVAAVAVEPAQPEAVGWQGLDCRAVVGWLPTVGLLHDCGERGLLLATRAAPEGDAPAPRVVALVRALDLEAFLAMAGGFVPLRELDARWGAALAGRRLDLLFDEAPSVDALVDWARVPALAGAPEAFRAAQAGRAAALEARRQAEEAARRRAEEEQRQAERARQAAEEARQRQERPFEWAAAHPTSLEQRFERGDLGERLSALRELAFRSAARQDAEATTVAAWRKVVVEQARAEADRALQGQRRATAAALLTVAARVEGVEPPARVAELLAALADEVLPGVREVVAAARPAAGEPFLRLAWRGAASPPPRGAAPDVRFTLTPGPLTLTILERKVTDGVERKEVGTAVVHRPLDVSPAYRASLERRLDVLEAQLAVQRARLAPQPGDAAASGVTASWNQSRRQLEFGRQGGGTSGSAAWRTLDASAEVSRLQRERDELLMEFHRLARATKAATVTTYQTNAYQRQTWRYRAARPVTVSDGRGHAVTVRQERQGAVEEDRYVVEGRSPSAWSTSSEVEVRAAAQRDLDARLPELAREALTPWWAQQVAAAAERQPDAREAALLRALLGPTPEGLDWEQLAVGARGLDALALRPAQVPTAHARMVDMLGPGQRSVDELRWSASGTSLAGTTGGKTYTVQTTAGTPYHTLEGTLVGWTHDEEVVLCRPGGASLAAVHVDTGAARWEVPLPGCGGALTPGGTLGLLRQGADARVLDLRDGATLWAVSAKVAGGLREVALAFDGRVVVVRDGERLRGLEGRTGEERWQTPLGWGEGPLTLAPTRDGRHLVALAGQRYLHLRLDDGAVTAGALLPNALLTDVRGVPAVTTDGRVGAVWTGEALLVRSLVTGEDYAAVKPVFSMYGRTRARWHSPQATFAAHDAVLGVSWRVEPATGGFSTQASAVLDAERQERGALSMPFLLASPSSALFLTWGDEPHATRLWE